jgi:MFS family permease
MYSETDINSAVEAGALSPEAAAAFRNHIALTRAAPAVDEESFRLLTGFNDIFVAIALALSLVAIGWIGGATYAPLGGLGVAVSAWLLAEYFTRQRRMALPSILLLLAFVGGVGGALVGLVAEINPDLPDRADALIAGGIALASAGAAWAHWRRFMVPITVAAGALALAGTALALTLAAIGPELAERAFYPLVLSAGVAVFALAMWWDMSDRKRTTRRADVAFWLHLAAAPLIAHPVFHLLGVFDGRIGAGMAVVVLGLYVVFGFVALAIDRRALLVSSLAYVLYALSSCRRRSPRW